MSGQAPYFTDPVTSDQMNRFVDYIERCLRAVMTNTYRLIQHELDPSSGRHSGILTEPYGGTGESTYALGDMLYAQAADNLGKLSVGAYGEVLTVSASGVPEWTTGGSFLLVSGQALSALRVVVSDASGRVIYADNTTTAHAGRVYGLTLTATSVAGQGVRVLFGGRWYEATWLWDEEKPLFLGASGTLTQTPPATGISQVVAQPITSQSINFAPLTAVVQV